MLIKTEKQFQEALEQLKNAKTIVLDTETNGLKPYSGNRIIGISFYIPDTEYSCYIAFRHGEGENWPLEYLEPLKPLLSDPNKKYLGWNLKFDQHFLTVDGFPILQNKAIYTDCMIMLHMLDENRYDKNDKRGLNYKLKDNAKMYLGDESVEAEDALKAEIKARGIKDKGEMWRLPASLVSDYAEYDVILTWKLYELFLPYLQKWNQVELFERKARINSTILARMEWYGAPVSIERIKEHIEINKSKAEEVKARLQQMFGKDFNPASPVQVSKALNIPNSKKTTLERTSGETAQLILDYKFYTKATGTFYTAYLDLVGLDGHIHPQFNMARTNSGRLSASDPNLQQIPREGKYTVKEVFVAPEGYKWVNVDYHTEELALCSHFSQDAESSAIIADPNGDLHTYTASKLFNIAEKDVQKPQRFIGKTANFGFAYGMGLCKAAAYISTSLKKTLAVDKQAFEEYEKRLPKTRVKSEVPDMSKPGLQTIVTDEWGANPRLVTQYATKIAITERKMYWSEFFRQLGPYALLVNDAREYQEMNPDCLTIYQTTAILDSWRKLFANYLIKAKEIVAEASSWRNEQGDPADEKTGHKYYRLADNTVRHFITGQKPYNAWNFLIQGTGGSVMRDALEKVDQVFPIWQDQVIPILTVHDSICFLVKDDENFKDSIALIKQCMERTDFYPPIRCDVEVGNSYGETEEYE